MKRVTIYLAGLLALTACKDPVDGNQVMPGGLAAVPGHDTVAQDNTHKEAPRLMAAESYMRSYLRLFGGLTALQAQRDLTSNSGQLFDAWSNYLAALGLPNYAIDLPRGPVQSGDSSLLSVIVMCSFGWRSRKYSNSSRKMMSFSSWMFVNPVTTSLRTSCRSVSRTVLNSILR